MKKLTIDNVNLKDKSKSGEFVRELKGLDSINFVNLLFDEEKFQAWFVNRIDREEKT